MEKQDYLISIVVPTKNRYIYLKELVKLINSFDDNAIEFVIQDNSDNNQEILDFLKSEQKDNIRYYYCNDQLAATENADKAILNSTGEFVCFIGDDDGVMSWITDVVRYMKREHIDSLISNKPNYSWPDVKSAIVDSSSSLNIIKPSSKILNIDPIKELYKTQKKGFLTMGNLPRVYQGIIKRSSLDDLYNQTGTFFPGPCPDMCNAVGLTYIVKKHVYVDFPVVISGAGYNSAAGMGARHKHSAKISEVSFLPKNTEDEWELTIPKYWLGQTIWPNTAIKALRNTGHSQEIDNINFNRIYGAVLAFHPNLFKIVLQYINIKNLIPVATYFFNFVLLRAKYLLINFLANKSIKIGNIKWIYDIPSIRDAENLLKTNYYSSTSILTL